MSGISGQFLIAFWVNNKAKWVTFDDNFDGAPDEKLDYI